jgi:hypothetical protein
MEKAAGEGSQFMLGEAKAQPSLRLHPRLVEGGDNEELPKLEEFGPKPKADFPPLLKASNLKEPVTYTIKGVEVRNLRGEAKPIASFEEVASQWVINKTNIAALFKKLGNVELAALAGHKVTLAAVATTYQGEQTEGIRIVQVL